MSRSYKKHYIPYPLENAKCELGKDIVQCLHAHQWTLKDFSQLIGISTKTLRKHIRGQTKYKISRYYMDIYEKYVYYPKITKDTPLEEIKAIHQRIWDYVIKYGHRPSTFYSYNCVVCEYTILMDRMCSLCPIQWPLNKRNERVCLDGLYTEWTREQDPIKKVELARQIRDLPFKYELEEKDNER